MSMYEIDDLFHRWERGELTAEQAMGYLLQNVVTLSERLAEAEKAIRKLDHEVTTMK